MLAHTGAPPVPGELVALWRPAPVVLLVAGVVLLLYARGLGNAWRTAGTGRSVARRQAHAFLAGMLIVIVSLLSPLDTLGSSLFAAHMLQHELLVVVAAPLLALSGFVVVVLWALPHSLRRAIARASVRAGRTRAWPPIVHPFGALALHVSALLLWHSPTFYQQALASDAAHAAQHASFLGTAVFFWWSIARAVRRGRGGHGIAVLALFGTAATGSALGAMLTFAPTAWYPHYAATAPAWGLSALEDQQLGGVIMWVPAGVVYVAAALLLVSHWLRAVEQRGRATRIGRDGAAYPRPSATAPDGMPQRPSQ